MGPLCALTPAGGHQSPPAMTGHTRATTWHLLRWERNTLPQISARRRPAGLATALPRVVPRGDEPELRTERASVLSALSLRLWHQLPAAPGLSVARPPFHVRPCLCRSHPRGLFSQMPSGPVLNADLPQGPSQSNLPRVNPFPASAPTAVAASPGRGSGHCRAWRTGTEEQAPAVVHQ